MTEFRYPADCLKWKDREQILTQEMRTYACDIVCLQVSVTSRN